MNSADEPAAGKPKPDAFSDRIILLLASGKRPKLPPTAILVEHLEKRGRLVYAMDRGLFVGIMSSGQGKVLVSLMPEVDAIERGEHLNQGKQEAHD